MQNEMRDRLVELIKQAKQNTKNANCDLERNLLFADSLIENGVVVLDTDVLLSEYRPLIITIADMPLNEVIELIKAKQEGRIIVPPCKVGDTVYCIEHKTIHECVVTLVKSLTYENKTMFFVEAECEIVSPFYSDGRKMKHGITAVWEVEYGSWYRAFLTKEQAEKALKEGAYSAEL